MRDSKTIADFEGLKLTNGPDDLFKILSETITVYHKSSQSDVAENLVNLAKKVIEYYQSLLALMLVSRFIQRD